MLNRQKDRFPEIGEFSDNSIDLQIKNLIEAMNRTGFIKTFCSCEGHEEEEPATVSFIMRYDRLNKLGKILNKANKKAEKSGILLDCVLKIVYYNEVLNCQEDLPEDFLSLELILDILEFEEPIWEAKKEVFAILEACFKGAK